MSLIFLIPPESCSQEFQKKARNPRYRKHFRRRRPISIIRINNHLRDQTGRPVVLQKSAILMQAPVD
jgi:hypothetical protein